MPGSRAAGAKQYENFYLQAVAQARGGDKYMADQLLAQFAELSKDPAVFAKVGGIPKPLIQYIATCISDWRKRGYQDAETHFWIDKASHRPANIGGKQVGAVRAFRLLMARGKGTEASFAGAAAYSGLSPDAVRYLVGKRDDIIEAAVLSRTNSRLHKRILHPPRKKYQRSR